MFSTMTTTKFQRTVTRLLLPIFTVWMIVNPVRSYAALPAAVGVYAVAPSAVGAVSNVIAGPWAGSAASAAGLTGAGAVSLGVGLSALAVGTALGYLIVDNLTGGYSRIPLTQNNPVPAPYAPSTASPQLTPTYSSSGCGATNLLLGDFLSACSAALCFGCGQYTATGVVDVGGGILYVETVHIPTGTVATGSASGLRAYVGVPQSLCPTGYTGSGCSLSNARSVTSDHAKDFVRSGTTLSPAAGDIDTSGADISVLPSGGLLVQDRTAAGEARHYTIIPAVDGGSQVEFVQPVTNAVGDTGTQRTVLTVAPDGTVTGRTQTTTGEQLGQDPATGLPVLNPAPSGATFTPSSPSGSTVNFPSDYAKTGEAQNAANTINSGFLTPVGIDPVASMDSRIANIAVAPTTPTINWMPSLLPGTATACHAMPIDGGVHGGLLNLSGSASFDICDKLDIVRQILGYFFMIATVVFVFRRFTRSNGETS